MTTKTIGVASILVLGLCLHTGTFAQIPPEVLRTLADHSDKIYYMEKTVKQLQTHVTDLTNRLDVMAAEKAHLTHFQDSSNSVCCNCCNDTTSSLPSTTSTTAGGVTSVWTPIQTEALSQSTTTPTTTTGLLSSTSMPVTIHPVPTCGWTPWIDRDTPFDGVEEESLSSNELGRFCPNGHVTAITCATGNGLPAYFTKELFMCTLATGLVCKNEDNGMIPCSNYKVRYFCECGPASTSTDLSTSTATPPSTTPNCNSSYWTPWIDRSKRPTPRIVGEWGDFTEHEQLTSAELAQQCNNGTAEAIDCRTVDGIPYYSSGELLTVRCTLGGGLVCKDVDNGPIPCNDYKVRYKCGCA